jgi:hypothetical protein
MQKFIWKELTSLQHNNQLSPPNPQLLSPSELKQF